MDIATESPSLVTGIRIELPFNDIVNIRKDSVKKECHLILYTDYIEYKNVSEFTELDTDSGIPTPSKCNYRWVRKRSALSEVAMAYQSSDEQYTITMDFDGIGDFIAWRFPTGKEAKVVYDILRNYFITQFSS